MAAVMPRVTYEQTPSQLALDVFVTLDNAEEEYIFAFNLGLAELRQNSDALREKVKKAAAILMADYAKRHPA